MTTMEDVLAAHGGHAFGREEADESRWFDKCECGQLLFGIDYSPEHKMRPGKSYANAAFAAHVAEALTAAGFGNLHDAWAEGGATTASTSASALGEAGTVEWGVAWKGAGPSGVLAFDSEEDAREAVELGGLLSRLTLPWGRAE